jgi:hypothetical protein
LAANWLPVCRGSWTCSPGMPSASTTCGPPRQLVEVAAPHRAAHDPGEHERTRTGLDVNGQVLFEVGDDRGWDADDAAARLHFGGPSTSGPVDRSMYAARTRTVRAFRSRSARVRAETSPHRRLAKVARSTSALVA